MALYKKTKSIILTIVTIALVTFLFYYSYQFFMSLAYPIKFEESVLKASEKHKVDKHLIFAIVREESRFNKDSVSSKGAVGLMQLMPQTARWICSQRSLKYNKPDLARPEVNIDYGTWYYNYLLGKYKDRDTALAAYNSGTKAIDDWLTNHPNENLNKFHYPETRNFVRKVNKSYKKYKKLYPEK